MKVIFFDTETTGLDPKVNAIHQLAGEIVIDGTVAAGFEYTIQPFNGCVIEMEALKVSNTVIESLVSYEDEHTQLLRFIEMLDSINASTNEDKYFLAGWRAPEFDTKFLKALFERNGLKTEYNRLFWTPSIDVKSLAAQTLILHRKDLTSFDLCSVARYVGVQVNREKLHSAAYDAHLCRLVCERVRR